MTKTPDVKDLLTTLNSVRIVPTEDDVLSHTILFRPSDWVKRWPNDLELPEFLQRDEKWLSVSRRRLFEMGNALTAHPDTRSAVEFYAAVCAWGAGSYGRQVYRCVAPLENKDASDKLCRGLTNIRDLSAEEAYSRFHHGGSAKIKGLGPAFFTKLMYFAYGRPTIKGTRHPLILDSRIAAALGWNVFNDWRTKQYSNYLDIVEHLHQEWRSDAPTDLVEYTLFNANRVITAPSI